jgi:glycosyltransferase involved in cell wall biosynthesis
MKIGINALFQGHGGALTNLTQLIEEWKKARAYQLHDFVLFVSQGTLQRLGINPTPEFRVITLHRSDWGLPFRLIVEQTQLARRVEKEKVDVLFCPGNTMPFTTRIPCVTTFQNAAPFCPNISFRTAGFRYGLRFYLLGFFMRLSARRSSRIIFISKHFRNIFVERFSFPAERGVVIYRARQEGVERLQEDLHLEQRYGIRRPYVLSVSHLYPFKNLLELIKGFVAAQRQGNIKPMQLVIVGGEQIPGYKSRLEALIRRLGVAKGDVLLTGPIPHHDVMHLITGCEVFAFSSTCENCPTALIEALSTGVPIACSNVGVMPEIAGDGAIYFDPYDPQDFENVLCRLMADNALRRQLRDRALQQAKKFPDPAEVARQTLSVLEQAGDEGFR